MIIVVVLIAVHCATAALPVFRNQDPLIIALDDMEGVLYEVPDYVDPQVIEHQLSSLNGGMPMFSLLDLARKQVESKDKDISQASKISESKKALEEIIYRLEATRSKLENGNSNVYIDLEKSIQGLKKLERNFRPDIRALFSSLRNLKPVANPVAMPSIMEIITTTRRPALYDKSSIVEIPQKYEKKIIDVQVISKGKPTLDQSPVDEELAKESNIGEKRAKGKSLLLQSLLDKEPGKKSEIGDKSPKRDNKFLEAKPINVEASSDNSSGIAHTTAAPLQVQETQRRERVIDEDDTLPNLYHSQWTWNTSRRLP